MTETLDKRIILNKCACGSKVNTNLKCGDADCQEFICPKCMIQTKTVPKCRKCAKLKKNPAFNPTPKELILSFVVCSISSIVLSIGINATLNIINNFAPGIIVFYLLLLVPPLLGWAIGYIIERTSIYKKSLTLTLIAGLSASAGHLIISFGFQVDFFYWLISLAITIYLSINKVKV